MRWLWWKWWNSADHSKYTNSDGSFYAMHTPSWWHWWQVNWKSWRRRFPAFIYARNILLECSIPDLSMSPTNFRENHDHLSMIFGMVTNLWYINMLFLSFVRNVSTNATSSAHNAEPIVGLFLKGSLSSGEHNTEPIKGLSLQGRLSSGEVPPYSTQQYPVQGRLYSSSGTLLLL